MTIINAYAKIAEEKLIEATADAKMSLQTIEPVIAEKFNKSAEINIAIAEQYIQLCLLYQSQ